MANHSALCSAVFEHQVKRTKWCSTGTCQSDLKYRLNQTSGGLQDSFLIKGHSRI